MLSYSGCQYVKQKDHSVQVYRGEKERVVSIPPFVSWPLSQWLPSLSFFHLASASGIWIREMDVNIRKQKRKGKHHNEPNLLYVGVWWVVLPTFFTPLFNFLFRIGQRKRSFHSRRNKRHAHSQKNSNKVSIRHWRRNKCIQEKERMRCEL